MGKLLVAILVAIVCLNSATAEYTAKEAHKVKWVKFTDSNETDDTTITFLWHGGKERMSRSDAIDYCAGLGNSARLNCPKKKGANLFLAPLLKQDDKLAAAYLVDDPAAPPGWNGTVAYKGLQFSSGHEFTGDLDPQYHIATRRNLLTHPIGRTENLAHYICSTDIFWEHVGNSSWTQNAPALHNLAGFAALPPHEPSTADGCVTVGKKMSLMWSASSCAEGDDAVLARPMCFSSIETDDMEDSGLVETVDMEQLVRVVVRTVILRIEFIFGAGIRRKIKAIKFLLKIIRFIQGCIAFFFIWNYCWCFNLKLPRTGPDAGYWIWKDAFWQLWLDDGGFVPQGKELYKKFVTDKK